MKVPPASAIEPSDRSIESTDKIKGSILILHVE